MRKILTPFTPEYALSRALAKFPTIEIADLVERTDKMVYRWSDPDDDSQISVKSAVMIDHLCLARAGFAPFADMFAALADCEHPRTCHTFGLREAAMHMQSAVGQFSGMLAEMNSDNTSPRERQALMLAIEDIASRMNDLRRAVAAQSKVAVV